MTPRDASTALLRAQSYAAAMEKQISRALGSPLGDVVSNTQAALAILEDVRAELETVTGARKRGAKRR